jgi:hypothetical protein
MSKDFAITVIRYSRIANMSRNPRRRLRLFRLPRQRKRRQTGASVRDGQHDFDFAPDTFRIANHNVVTNIVKDWNPQPLTPEQVDLISRQLDERFRDVED